MLSYIFILHVKSKISVIIYVNVFTKMCEMPYIWEQLVYSCNYKSMHVIITIYIYIYIFSTVNNNRQIL